MELQQKQLLEGEGLQVIEGAFDFKFKTRIFIRHPDGRLNPYYDFLHQIPVLPNGTEADLNINAMPYDPIYGSTAVKKAGAITNTEYELDAEGNRMPIPPVIVGYIILAAILLAIVIFIYFLVHPPVQEPPCGTTAQTVDVSDCAKIIIMPNCDSRLFDACTDEWLEEDWHRPPAAEIDWKILIIIGIAAVGVIIIVPQILRVMKPPKKSPKK